MIPLFDRALAPARLRRARARATSSGISPIEVGVTATSRERPAERAPRVVANGEEEAVEEEDGVEEGETELGGCGVHWRAGA